MKQLITIGLFNSLVVPSLYAQVGIGTDSPSSASMLEVSSGEKKNLGFLGPKVKLVDSSLSEPINNPKKGLIIYNTETVSDLTPGYYFWNGMQWRTMTEKKTYTKYYVDGIRVAVLGYYPYGDGNKSPDVIEYSNIQATKMECVKNSTNTGFASHSYCGYKINREIDFEEAFNLAKTAGGFLPVITTSEEWNYLKTNLVTTNTSDIWIGYSRAQYPGTVWNNQYIWITGERSKIGWSQTTNTGAPIETNFAPSESFSGDCSYISGNSTNKYWQTRDCNTAANTTYLIVELLN